MDRLTVDTDLSFCDIAQCSSTPGGSFCEDGYCDQRRCYERLREYECIGTIEEFRQALRRTAEHDKAMEEGLTRGAELVRAESLIGKQLYVCWRGDTADQVCIRDISSVCITDDGKISLEDGPYDGFVCYMDEIGKWDYDKFVGLTRQEAETALDGGGEGGN